jgi:phenylalanyl-tRNA synthetase alpha chain
VQEAGNVDALETIRVDALGKKGEISGLMKSLGTLSPEERKEAGQRLNVLKDSVSEAIAARKELLEQAALDAKLAFEAIDLTLPPRPETEGRLHPISQTIDEIIAIFGEMGFSVAEGPDIEDDFKNFTALNIPPDHPARQMQDTFYLPPQEDGSRMVLRTHTSPVQIRTMQAGTPPFRIVSPGRTYRCDSDQTHTPMFHQIEGLVIDRDVHMGHLKWTLDTFMARFFETSGVVTRFRPHHFPFTEPSAEVDVQCDRSGGEVRIGQGSDWLEVAGCGMVHPNVLRNCGLDPEEWQGFAFGLGVDRFGMLKYGMPDLRDMFAADSRWLAHYGFSHLAMPNPGTGLS